MKHAKKLMALLMALTMLLSLTVTAFATSGDSSTTGSITVNNTVKGTAYSIYKIFDLESFSDDTADNHSDGAYSYKVNSAWNGFFAEGAEGLNYVNIDANGYVTWKENASAAEFAAKAIAYATAVATKINPVDTKSATADNTPVEFTGLSLGYYLVDSSLGALCALTTTNPNATVTEKNANPTLTKQVQEDSTGSWGDKNDATIGDTVNFQATITVQGAANGYVMHDVMDPGLTFGDVTSVTLNGNTVPQTDNYIVAKNVNHDDAPGLGYTHTFDVTFTDKFCNTLKSGDTIVVFYTATLNAFAASASNDVVCEKNSAHLTYKDNNDTEHSTEPSVTKTFDWSINIFKYYQSGETKTPLAGATFTISKNQDGSDPITLTNKFKLRDTDMAEEMTRMAITSSGSYRVATAGDEETVTQITTGENGELSIHGLDEGTYYLTEVTAPKGYNKLSGPIKVIITSAQDATDTTALTSTVAYYNHTGDTTTPYADDATDTGRIEVENKSGTELPSTGGMGTTIFYVVGSVLLVGAAVLLITKKRMSAAR